jgi:hypothetical protein
MPPGRGIPPPIPPNKPVVPPKKETVSAPTRRPELSSSAAESLPAEGKGQKMAGGTQAVKFGISITKDKIPPQGAEIVDGRRDPQVGVGSQSSHGDCSSTHVDAASNARSQPAPASIPTDLHEPRSPTSAGHGFEMLDPELADFQQILISMAAGKKA